MNTNWKWLRRMASVLLLGLAVAGCASGPKIPSPELQQRIETARTRDDHAALGTYFDQEAMAARASATGHRKMARSYQGMTVGAKGGYNMPAHCNSIVNLYESLATEYDGLAEVHRQMVKSAPL